MKYAEIIYLTVSSIHVSDAIFHSHAAW